MLRKIVLTAVLASSWMGCDHVIGNTARAPGVTPIGNTWFANLNAVFAVSDDEVYVAGDNGISRLDGTNLSRATPEALTRGGFIDEISAVGPGEIIASGRNDRGEQLLLTLRDGVWRRETPPMPEGAELFSVFRMVSTLHAPGAAEPSVLLVGTVFSGDPDWVAAPQVLSYSAGAYTTVPVPGTATHLWDVGLVGDAFYFRHPEGLIAVEGDTTRELTVPWDLVSNLIAFNDGTQNQLLGFSREGGFYALRDGEWTMTQTEALGIVSIDGRALDDLYAVGEDGGFFHFDGVSWTRIASGTTEVLRDVHVLPNGNVFVVGARGAGFVYVP